MKKRLLQKQINELRLAMRSSGDAQQRRDIAGLDSGLERLQVRVKHLDEKINALGAMESLDVAAKSQMLTEALGRLNKTNVDEMLKKLDWLHDRHSLLANRLDIVTAQYVAIGEQLLKLGRLGYAVGKFDARLTRLEQPLAPAAAGVTTPAKPHKRRPRKKNGPVVPEAPKPLPMLDE